jgi:CDP-diglyceride synthetase
MTVAPVAAKNVRGGTPPVPSLQSHVRDYLQRLRGGDMGSLPAIAGLAVIVAVGAVWGDLLESAAKREFVVKDAGGWLPGFGGILDRVDSLLLAMPLVYWAVRLLDPASP